MRINWERELISLSNECSRNGLKSIYPDQAAVQTREYANDTALVNCCTTKDAATEGL